MTISDIEILKFDGLSMREKNLESKESRIGILGFDETSVRRKHLELKTCPVFKHLTDHCSEVLNSAARSTLAQWVLYKVQIALKIDLLNSEQCWKTKTRLFYH
jgi:hypothetical protein